MREADHLMGELGLMKTHPLKPGDSGCRHPVNGLRSRPIMASGRKGHR